MREERLPSFTYGKAWGDREPKEANRKPREVVLSQRETGGPRRESGIPAATLRALAVSWHHVEGSLPDAPR